MAINLQPFKINVDDKDYPAKHNAAIDGIEEGVNQGLADIDTNLTTLSNQITSELGAAETSLSNQITSELGGAVEQVEVYRDQAGESAQTAANQVVLAQEQVTLAEHQVGLAANQVALAAAQAVLAESHKNLGLTYRNEARDARDQAVAIAYGGGYSVTPTPGNVPIAGSTGTLEKGWIAAEYSVQLIEHINYVLDITETVRKDQPSNRDTDALVQMLLQISDLAGQAAKTLAGIGEYKASAGSAARCSIAHRTNPGTGIFFPASDEIAFSVNGVEVLRIDSSGIVP